MAKIITALNITREDVAKFFEENYKHDAETYVEHGENIMALFLHLEANIGLLDSFLDGEELGTRELFSLYESLDEAVQLYDNGYYLVMTEDEADEQHKELFDNMIEDTYLRDLPEQLKVYFDMEQARQDEITVN